MHKYGREFSLGAMENRDNCVSDRVMKKLVLSTPSPELVDAYLFEIAKGYGVNWTPPKKEGDVEPKETEREEKGIDEKKDKEEVLGSVKAKVEADVKVPKLPDIPPTEDPEPKGKEEKPMDEFEALAKRFEALKKR